VLINGLVISSSMALSKPKKSILRTKPTAEKKRKIATSSVGAPSQHKQASRKGKRAWRKNVNIEDVEEGLEGLRAEERVTG
jgi:nucleolar protein 53